MTHKQDSLHNTNRFFFIFNAAKVCIIFEFRTIFINASTFLRISFGYVQKKSYFCALEMLITHIIHFIKISKQ